MARYGIVVDTDLPGIERITPLSNGIDSVRELSRFLDVLGPEIQSLHDAVVARSPAISTSKLKKRDLAASGI